MLNKDNLYTHSRAHPNKNLTPQNRAFTIDPYGHRDSSGAIFFLIFATTQLSLIWELENRC